MPYLSDLPIYLVAPTLVVAISGVISAVRRDTFVDHVGTLPSSSC